jgi:hypothetical protein
MKEIHVTFDSKKAKDKLLADEKFVKALTSLYTLADNINGRVEAEIMEANNDIKQKVKEQCRDCIYNWSEQNPNPKDNTDWCYFWDVPRYPCMKKI